MCNATVDFLIRRPGLPHDFKFASLQSSFAPTDLAADVGAANDLSTVVYQVVLGGERRVYYRSDAILHVLMSLGGGWRAMAVFLIVPRFIRDGAYRFFAHNRYRWFGRRDTCRVPTAEEKSRFLS